MLENMKELEDIEILAQKVYDYLVKKLKKLYADDRKLLDDILNYHRMEFQEIVKKIKETSNEYDNIKLIHKKDIAKKMSCNIKLIRKLSNTDINFPKAYKVNEDSRQIKHLESEVNQYIKNMLKEIKT